MMGVTTTIGFGTVLPIYSLFYLRHCSYHKACTFTWVLSQVYLFWSPNILEMANAGSCDTMLVDRLITEITTMKVTTIT